MRGAPSTRSAVSATRDEDLGGNMVTPPVSLLEYQPGSELFVVYTDGRDRP